MTNLNWILIFIALAATMVTAVLISSYRRRGERIENLRIQLDEFEKDRKEEVERMLQEKEEEKREAGQRVESTRRVLEMSRQNNVQMLEISQEEAMGVKAESLVKVLKANGYKEITSFAESPKELCGMGLREFAVKRTERWLKDMLKEESVDRFQILLISRSGSEQGGYRGWLFAKQAPDA